MENKMNRFLVFVLTLFLALSLFACADSSTLPVDQDNFEAIQRRGYIVVGLECGYAPFNWTVEESAASDYALPIDGTSAYCDGYDIVIAKAIADDLGVDLVVKSVDWDGLIPSLATNGQIDMIIAGMSPTAERALTVLFSDEYYRSTHVVVLRSDSAFANATSIDDFSGANVVGQMSTIYDDLIEQMTGANHVNPLGDVPTIVTGISSGTYDATILELPVAIAICEANPELTYLTFASGSGFDVSAEDAAVAIAVRLSEVTLVARINLVLASITDEDREAWMLSAIDRQPA